VAQRGLGDRSICGQVILGSPGVRRFYPSGPGVILAGMTTILCHDCRAPLPEGLELWRAPDDGRPDEDSGEPYCPECAAPLGIAA
jgi:hypothetical protein